MREAMIGKTVSHYEILARLGKGGMGEVYRAHDMRLDRDVALKILPADLADNAEHRQRFEREVKAIAALKHANIVTIHSVEEDNGIAFYTMELIDGRTLSEIKPKDGLPLARIFDIAVPVTDALSRAHEHGITHRDLKPTNIMLDRDGTPKLLDFGLAKLTEPAGTLDGRTVPLQDYQTGEGRILGTVAYMSPEQAEGKPVDHRSDIFSFGIVLYEMASGQQPFRGDTPVSTITSILRDTPPPVTQLRRALPRHLGRIVTKCLEKDPDRRYQSVLDLRNDLQALKEEIDSGELEPETAAAAAKRASATSRHRTRRTPGWLWLPGILAAAAAIAIWIFWLRPQAGPDGPTVAMPGQADVERVAADHIPEGIDANRTMIVVLPFENLGPPEQAYFAAGMTEEITSRLAVVSGLGVISRTSATQYDRTGKTVRQIGADLGVDYLLEGTIRWDRSGDRTKVRITPQLIRVADDTHVWSNPYDRVLEDIFAIQTEIADQTIKQLGIALQEPERQALEHKPTDNLLAYEIYLRGLEHMHRPSSREEDLQSAERMFEQAVELDPGFALAYSRLSETHSEMVFWGFNHSEQRKARAKAAADRALELEPDLPEAHRALGTYYYDCFFDYDRALKEFAIAAKGLPNDPEILEVIAYIWRRQGLFDDAIANLHRAADLNPRNAWLQMQLGYCYACTKEPAKADRHLSKSIALDPDQGLVYFIKGLNHGLWDGNIDKARAALAAAPNQAEPLVVTTWYLVEMASRNFQAALDRISVLPAGLSGGASNVIIKDLMAGRAHEAMGHHDRARALFESARTTLEGLIVEDPKLAEAFTDLGRTYAYLGRKQDAVRTCLHGIDLVKDDAMRRPMCQTDLAKVYILVGEHEAAIDLIEQLLANRWTVLSPHLLRLDPDYDPLRDNPRFQRLVAGPSNP